MRNNVFQGLLLLLVACFSYTFIIEPRWIETNTIPIIIDGLPNDLEGLRIVQLSDLHVGPYFSKSDIDRAVEISNKLNPDLVVVTGDFISQGINNIYPSTEALKALHPRLGTYAVLGNHEYFTGEPDTATEAISTAGIRVLRNEALPLSKEGKGIWLIGVDDMWFHYDDLAKALNQVPPDSKTIMLSHNPDLAPKATQQGVNLVLSGHTHGGQISLPFIGPLKIPNEHTEFVAGLYRLDKTWLYVNKGIGAVTPPARLMTRPEVTLFILHSQ